MGNLDFRISDINGFLSEGEMTIHELENAMHHAFQWVADFGEIYHGNLHNITDNFSTLNKCSDLLLRDINMYKTTFERLRETIETITMCSTECVYAPPALMQMRNGKGESSDKESGKTKITVSDIPDWINLIN